jgi:hypothetical protein
MRNKKFEMRNWRPSGGFEKDGRFGKLLGASAPRRQMRRLKIDRMTGFTGWDDGQESGNLS